MPRKANEIVVEWLESRDKGKRHRVNVKHIIECLEEVEVEREVTVKLNTKRYRGVVVDLLDWAPPKKKRKTKKSGKKATKSLWLGIGQAPAASTGTVCQENPGDILQVFEERSSSQESHVHAPLQDITNMEPPPDSPLSFSSSFDCVSPISYDTNLQSNNPTVPQSTQPTPSTIPQSTQPTPSIIPQSTQPTPSTIPQTTQPTPSTIRQPIQPMHPTIPQSTQPMHPTIPQSTHPTHAQLYPFTPTQFNPSTPTQFNPSTPTQFNPSTPTQFNPSTPTQFNPSTPTHFNPSTPTQFNPSTPTQFNLFTPTQFNPSTPTQFNPSTPIQFNPSTPTQFNPSTHTQFNLSTPTQFNPSTPTHFHPSMPTQFNSSAPTQFYPSTPTQFYPQNIYLQSAMYPQIQSNSVAPVQPMSLPGYLPWSQVPSIPRVTTDPPENSNFDDWVDLDEVFEGYSDGPPYTIKQKLIDDCYKKASSRSNFAVQLVRKSFSKLERATSNCAGDHRYKKKKLSPERMSAVKKATSSIYPVRPGQTEEEWWKSFKIAIDSSCRSLNRTAN